MPDYTTDRTPSPEDKSLEGPNNSPESSSRGPHSSSAEAIVGIYKLKWITWKDEFTPIVMQSTNGPCPLIAIANLLLLNRSLVLPAGSQTITAPQLIKLVESCLVIPESAYEAGAETLANYERNVRDAKMLLPQLENGLDVNVRFTGISDFEYTAGNIVFDVLNIRLYHGWIVDPDMVEVRTMIGTASYNQIVEKIIEKKMSTKSQELAEALMVEDFLKRTSSQLTNYGLLMLILNVPEEELCILFRNNHFITLYKHENQLYQLVTDEGFLAEMSVVWETLSNVTGDECFVDSDFAPFVSSEGGSAEHSQCSEATPSAPLPSTSMAEPAKLLHQYYSMK